MVGGTELVEFEEANIEALVEDFCNEYETEFKEYRDIFAPTGREEIEWATAHPDWGGFVERAYNNRGAE